MATPDVGRRKPEPTWGVCFNCGSAFPRKYGYPLSAHIKDCFGRDGRSPHPANKAMTNEQRSVAARQAMQRRKAAADGLSLKSDGLKGDTAA